MNHSRQVDDRRIVIDERLPFVVRKVAGLAVRVAATRDGAPSRCLRRACRKEGRCRADLYGCEGARCTGRLSGRAVTEVEAMMAFLGALSVGA